MFHFGLSELNNKIKGRVYQVLSSPSRVLAYPPGPPALLQQPEVRYPIVSNLFLSRSTKK
ncbi:hypothetical protein M6B38_321590 [Iris pallida]|uniref:Uncharacterized protein n=1 Tax=Iris pallida TaxID=29817 RepID=A0AAX6HCR0_IRIPA|nr:hypothetical protein M6B38_321590 [Iris pallida]